VPVLTCSLKEGPALQPEPVEIWEPCWHTQEV